MKPPPNQERFMRRAIELARKGVAAGDGGPFGCVIVRDGKIVGEGWNRVVGTNDPTAHGEMVAIRDACAKAETFSLKGCELYTTGEPCPMCLSAIYWARLDRVYFGFTCEQASEAGFDDSLFHGEVAKEPGKRRIPEVQLLGEEAAELLKAYTAEPGRVKY